MLITLKVTKNNKNINVNNKHHMIIYKQNLCVKKKYNNYYHLPIQRPKPNVIKFLVSL